MSVSECVCVCVCLREYVSSSRCVREVNSVQVMEEWNE